jgi:hypothetical protein
MMCADPEGRPMFTVHCPGCGRAIPVAEEELDAVFLTCARCETRFVPRRDLPDGGEWPHPRRPGADAAGVISLMFGCVAVVMLILCPVSGGLTAYVALALAFVGMPLALSSRGRTRWWDFAINLLVFVLAAAGAAVFAR